MARNLVIEVKAFDGKNNVGALAGLLYRDEVTNCHVQGTLSGNYDIGLLISYNQGGTIEYSTATGAVVSRGYSAGGLVGANYSYYSDGEVGYFALLSPELYAYISTTFYQGEDFKSWDKIYPPDQWAKVHNLK